MLSNTAVPKYYGKFREAVKRGEEPVNAYISMEMNRIDALIESPVFYYDPDPVEGWISFCEEELTLTDGSDFKMLPSFKLWGEQVWGWYYFIERSVYIPNRKGKGGRYVKMRIKKRLTKKQFLIVGRGAAKTLYATSNHAYVLNVNPTTTDGIVTAPTMTQAEETLAPLKTAISRARGPLFKFLTMGSLQNTSGAKMNRPQLASTKKGIQNFLTNSITRIRPMSIDKLQGLRCAIASVDEWLSGEIREDPIGAIEQGCAKGDNDYVIIATSSEGTVRNGCGDTIKMELMSILKGEYIAPQVSIFWYRLDDVKEINDPAMWRKANPNIGTPTVSYETYQNDVERAEKNPSARNDIIAKRFGIPLEGYTYFFTYEETQTHKKRSFWSMPCSLGIDLSQGNDFCAFTFMFPISSETFGIKALCYISSRTLDTLPTAMRLKYEDFLKEGSLRVLNGTTLDMDNIYDDVDQFIQDHQYDVRTVGYDPYNADHFISRWITDNSEFGLTKVIQGSKTESVPLGELKKLAEDRLLLFDEEIMKYCMGNSITIEDTNGNRKLLKRRYEQKIDAVSAMMDAYIAYKNNKDAFE